MVDKELFSRKLSRLRSYVDELARADDITWEKYRTDMRTRAFVERYLHLAIEEVLDIANHAISFQKWREPGGYRDLFLILRENEVIKDEHLPIFQEMASFRNVLVHRYESLDDEIVFGIFKKRLPDFDLFIKLISGWVQKQESI
jgi:uncharacterized protein YutE (UPF0331/DUF86 family)